MYHDMEAASINRLPPKEGSQNHGLLLWTLKLVITGSRCWIGWFIGLPATGFNYASVTKLEVVLCFCA